MGTGIYLIQGEGKLVEMKEESYATEDLLQGLLANYPNLLAGDQINSAAPRRWLLVKREFGLPSEEDGGDRWSLDHLFLDQDAIPTIVEAKRSSDPRLRREVVGQMLDYAANAVVYLPVETIRARFEETCQGREPGQVIREAFGEEIEPDEFWQRVKLNLQAGKIRLVFVADEIPNELRRVVEFLNRQMDPAEVLAIEIKQYAGGETRALVPRLMGAAKLPGDEVARQWNETTFFRELKAKAGDGAAEVGRRILAWTKARNLQLVWGRGKRRGSFYPTLDHKGSKHYVIAVWTFGRIEFEFKSMQTRPPFDDESKRRELLGRLNKVPGADIPEDALSRFPSIPLTLFQDGIVLKGFLDTLDWFFNEVKAS